MFFRDIFGTVALSVHQLHLDLQRSVAQQPRKLRLRFDFGRHQVKHKQLERTYILGYGARLRHNKYILLCKSFHRRKLIRNFNRHCKTVLYTFLRA